MATNAVTRALAASRALRLPASFTSTHQTAGLPGFPATDVFGAAGTPVLAPVGGRMVYVHQIPWNAQQRVGGETAYLQGANDRTYFLTHLGGDVPTGNVTAGEQIGTVGAVPQGWWQPHIHEGEYQGTYNPPGASSAQSETPSASDPLATTLQQAGFKGDALRTAYAIAERESGGRPTAFNPNASTGDLSYGLFQINMLGGMGPARRRQFGISSNKALFDPNTNARAAFQLSKGGTDFGAWGLGPNAYRHVPLDTSVVPTNVSAPPPAALAQVDSGPPAANPPPQAAAAPQPNIAERMRSGIVSALLAHGGQINPQTLLNVALNARRAR